MLQCDGDRIPQGKWDGDGTDYGRNSTRRFQSHLRDLFPDPEGISTGDGVLEMRMYMISTVPTGCGKKLRFSSHLHD